MNNYIGSILGNYCTGCFVGWHGAARVYLGEHIYLGTPAYIYILHLQHSCSKEMKLYFLREMYIHAHLDHPHIVPILEYGVDDSIPYFITAHTPDYTIYKQYAAGSIVPLAMLVQHTKELASALQHAHDHHMLHGAIKPANILLGKAGDLLLSNFTLTINHNSAVYRLPQKDRGVYYLAPEQIFGQACFASDQYALGVVVYEWLCGDRPFTGTDREIALQHLQTLPPSLRKKMPTIPLAIEQVVLRALAKDPSQRFPAVQHFAQALEQAYRAHRSACRAMLSMYVPRLKNIQEVPTTFPPVSGYMCD